MKHAAFLISNALPCWLHGGTSLTLDTESTGLRLQWGLADNLQVDISHGQSAAMQQGLLTCK